MMSNLLFLLQVRVAQTACMSACQHVAKSLMAMLLSEDVKQMSLAALEQVNLDVIQCERNYIHSVWIITSFYQYDNWSYFLCISLWFLLKTNV